MKDYLRNLIQKRRDGEKCGISSFCTANALVIEACLERGKNFDDCVLIEATANQVNQFGGYTGMRPADFRDFVFEIADRIGFPIDRIILGGDHLGPLTWSSLPEAEAMKNSVALVKEFVLAGYKKIHLDTSMRLADDSRAEILKDSVIARRGAVLYKACEEAYAELLKKNPDEMRPVFIIGSEVPIPGGSQQAEEEIDVTKPEALEATLEAYRKAFADEGIKDAFDNIIGVVVQPGVEFGDDDFFTYNREKAAALTACAAGHKKIVLEGHSTDYQPASALREMVEDGIAILKVGPALTFGLREGLFALDTMEKLLIKEDDQADFRGVLEKTMLAEPKNWIKHYHGTEDEIRIKRMFSFSDRCRYYLTNPDVVNAQKKLMENMSRIQIPMGMLHQYMPVQYDKVRDGKLKPEPKELVKDFVGTFIDDYNYACEN